MAEKTGSQGSLGFIFLILGVSLTISMGTTLGIAFIGIGLPFLVLGIILLANGNGEGGKDRGEDG